MSSIKIDASNDIEIINNDLFLLGGRDEIAQVLRQELRVFLGEWFLNTDEGIPYLQEILKKNPNVSTVDAIFKNKILESPGVIELTEYTLDFENRKLRLYFKARTEEGIITFDEVLI